MRAGTLVLLLLAGLFGVAAVFLSNIWLNNQQPIAAAVSGNVQVEDTIVVSAVPLRFGDRLTVENTREIPWTASVLPAGSFRNKAELLESEIGDRQVLTPFEPNEPILNWKITGPGQRATLSATLTDGMKAIAIRVNDVLGVAGFVLPGDRVDIMLTRTGNGGDDYVDVLLQGVRILAIDQSANDREEDPTVAKTVTVEVNTPDAQRLTLAAGVGQLSLALREAASGDREVTRRISLGDLTGEAIIPAEAIDPALITGSIEPVEAGVEQAPAPVTSSLVSVRVMRGITLDTYLVPTSRQ